MNLKELKILMDYIKKEHIKYIVRIIETNGKNIIKPKAIATICLKT